jgi:hypothetical protein
LPHVGNPKVPLWITEGAKKVDSGLSNGVRCVIGLNGVYGWRGTNGDGGKAALPDWEAVALNGRKVVLAFDSDCMTKKEVRGALVRLADFLKVRGAEVGYCVMPDLPDGGKCGLDDFFAQGKTFDDLRRCIVKELPKSRSEEAEPELVWAYEVASETMEWIWEGWIPKRMLTILGGFGGDGKKHDHVEPDRGADERTAAARRDHRTADERDDAERGGRRVVRDPAEAGGAWGVSGAGGAAERDANDGRPGAVAGSAARRGDHGTGDPGA